MVSKEMTSVQKQEAAELRQAPSTSHEWESSAASPASRQGRAQPTVGFPITGPLREPKLETLPSKQQLPAVAFSLTIFLPCRLPWPRTRFLCLPPK